MAYDAESLAEAVRERLRDAPLTKLKSLAGSLGVDRHTLLRAVRVRFHRSFREMRNDAIRSASLHLLRTGANRSIKGIACELGYSPYHPETFSRRLRKLEGNAPTVIRRIRRTTEQS